MACVYQPSSYDSLPALHTAGERLRERGGEHLIANSFRQLFMEHHVERIFGLILLHRHFDLSREERLVEYRGTSTPWSREVNETTAHVHPLNWRLNLDGSYTPYEFHYAKDDANTDEGTPNDPKLGAFLDSYQKLLHEKDVVDTFGLTRYPGDNSMGTVEITQGRANINLQKEDLPSGVPMLKATWFFGEAQDDGCFCVEKPDHSGHVTTR